MDEKEKDVVVDDESALDKELEETITTIKAGNVPEPTAPVKAEEPPKEEPKAEQPSEAPSDEGNKEEGYEFRIPNKGKFESDESYEKRIELLDLVKKRKLAKSEDQRQVISEKIETTKNQLKNLNGVDKIINPLNSVEKPSQPEEDEATKADRERLKQLGGATKEDIAEIVRQERIVADTKSTLEKFVERYPDLKDADVREVFFDFVDTNYNWNGKTGKELMTVLELARENMFRPSETIQDRVLKGANVQEKINAMQFPGGTVAKSDYSPEMRKSIDELKATGMSEEKAVELLTE
jgi:hypothetical protein